MNSSTADYPVSDAVTTNQLDYVHESFYVLNGLIGSVICIIGILGNIFTIFIFSKMIKVNHSATTVFLLAMAVADLFVVVFYLLYGLLCLATPPVPLLSAHDFTIDQVGGFVYTYYYLWTYPTNTFVTISTWLTVSVMVFRFIAVYHPLKATRWCSTHRSRSVMIAVIVLSIMLYIPGCFVIRIHHVSQFNIFLFIETDLARNEMFHYVYFVAMIEIMNSFLPFGICLCLTVLLIYTLSKSENILLNVTSSKSVYLFRKRRARHQRRISAMLIIIVAIFIICTIPSLFWMSFKYHIKQQIQLEDSWMKLRGVADIFQVIRHSSNFIIYISTCQQYVKTFKKIIFCMTSKRVFQHTSVEVNSCSKSFGKQVTEVHLLTQPHQVSTWKNCCRKSCRQLNGCGDQSLLWKPPNESSTTCLYD